MMNEIPILETLESLLPPLDIKNKLGNGLLKLPPL